MFPTRVHRNMTNCMDTCGDFSSVINLVNTLRSREEANRPKSAGTVYNRYDQEKFQGAAPNGFQIQTGMSFHGINLIELSNIHTEKHETGQAKTVMARKRPCPTKPNEVRHAKKKRTSRTPIIVVPAGGTAIISKLNAKHIFEEHKFVPAGKQKQSGSQHQQDVLILRCKNVNENVPYRIVDDPAKLSSEEWERVVAVFVNGRAWQFKSWPWNGNPTEICSRICAFHIKFDDVKLDANVAKWNCKVLNLSKSKRHLDKAIFTSMWKTIEQFTSQKKPNLRS